MTISNAAIGYTHCYGGWWSLTLVDQLLIITNVGFLGNCGCRSSLELVVNVVLHLEVVCSTVAIQVLLRAAIYNRRKWVDRPVSIFKSRDLDDGFPDSSITARTCGAAEERVQAFVN